MCIWLAFIGGVGGGGTIFLSGVNSCGEDTILYNTLYLLTASRDKNGSMSMKPAIGQKYPIRWFFQYPSSKRFHLFILASSALKFVEQSVKY